MTPEEFAAKIESEGSLDYAFREYGLRPKDLNRDDDPEFYDAVKAYVDYFCSDEAYEIEGNLESLLEDME